MKAQIQHSEVVVRLLNHFIALTFGLISIIVNIVFFALEMNFHIELSLTLGKDDSELEALIRQKQKVGLMVVNSIATLKPIGLLIWAYISQLQVKEKKVTTVVLLKRSFAVVMTIFATIVILRASVSIAFISMIKDKPQEQYNSFLKVFIVLNVMFLVVTMGVLAMYFFALNRFGKAMVDFHTFLNSYRQTPRSRNLKKY